MWTRETFHFRSPKSQLGVIVHKRVCVRACDTTLVNIGAVEPSLKHNAKDE